MTDKKKSSETLQKSEQPNSFLAKPSPQDLPYELAYDAHRGTSFEPELRAVQDQQQYLNHMRSVYAKLAPLANTPEKRNLLTEEMERYRQRWLEKYKEFLHAESHVVSSMISGSTNFPVARMEKLRSRADKKRTELHDFEERAFAAIERALTPERGPIKSADAEAVEKLETKLAKLEETQALYKKINKAHAQFLKDPGSLDHSDLSDKLKETIRTYTPRYSWEAHPIPPYELQNNNKEIHRIRKRITEVSKMKASPHTETLYSDGIRVVENPDLGRIQVFFPSKPSRDSLTIIKGSGFHWSPKEAAWQRHLNDAGRYAAQSVMERLAKAKVEVTPNEPTVGKAVEPATQSAVEAQEPFSLDTLEEYGSARRERLEAEQPNINDQVDFTIESHSTIYVFTPQTKEATQFSRTELGLEPWQWLGPNSFAVETRPAMALTTQLEQEGWRINFAPIRHDLESALPIATDRDPDMRDKEETKKQDTAATEVDSTRQNVTTPVECKRPANRVESGVLKAR
jgi:hypothetical protein